MVAWGVNCERIWVVCPESGFGFDSCCGYKSRYGDSSCLEMGFDFDLDFGLDFSLSLVTCDGA